MKELFKGKIPEINPIKIFKTKQKIIGLYKKHQIFIDDLMEEFNKFVNKEEDEKLHINMVSNACSQAIMGFETRIEQEKTLVMIQTTLKELWKEEDKTK